MRRELFDYALKPEQIASRPLDDRDGARLMVLDREQTTHACVRDLPELLPAGALLVVNDTRVIPARLLGRKVGSGGRVELLLVERAGEAGDRAMESARTTEVRGGAIGDGTSLRDADLGAEAHASERWLALGRASKPLRPGAVIAFDRRGEEAGEPPALTAEIVGRADDAGLVEVTLRARAGARIEETVEAIGHVPLPPYMRRADEASDRERYQTVFARVPGAIAAPTAGLHLSTALLDRLRARGVEIAAVTLHVGLGTFQPVTAADFDQHPMHAETFVVPAETAAAIDRARERGAPVIAAGTTVVRALESAADPERPGRVRARAGETRLLIQPGYAFRVVDQLFTNFHLPQSTLLALVAAFAGRERVLAAYATAIDAGYRFYSYGDAMLIRSREGAMRGSA